MLLSRNLRVSQPRVLQIFSLFECNCMHVLEINWESIKDYFLSKLYLRIDFRPLTLTVFISEMLFPGPFGF
jgi:hypothetical protein